MKPLTLKQLDILETIEAQPKASKEVLIGNVKTIFGSTATDKDIDIAYNGSRLGEVGDFENETLKLLLNLN